MRRRLREYCSSESFSVVLNLFLCKLFVYPKRDSVQGRNHKEIMGTGFGTEIALKIALEGSR